MLSLMHCFLKCFSGFGGPGLGGMLRQQVNASLEMQQNSMEALQQRVVQIASDAGPLADALFQAHVELPRQLPQPQLIQRPQQCQKHGRTESAEPVRLVVSREDREIQLGGALVPDAVTVAWR